MRKPIVVATSAVLLLVGLTYGATSETEAPRREPATAVPPGIEGLPKAIDGSGRWQRMRTHRFDPDLSDEQRRMIEQLEAIGYASGLVEDDRSRITIHQRGRASPGLNLYTSGRAPEAVLMDMDGRVLHRWRHTLEAALPGFPVPSGSTSTDWWRRVHLYENADLLAIFEGLALIKLDADSKLLWANPISAHHELDVLPSGDVLVPTRERRTSSRTSAP